MNSYRQRRRIGRLGESRFVRICEAAGRSVEQAAYGSGYDFIVDGRVAVEIKTGCPRISGKGRTWTFGLLRNGKLRESADWYAFCLHRGFPDGGDIWAAYRCPIGTASVAISLPRDLGQVAPMAGNFGLLISGGLSSQYEPKRPWGMPETFDVSFGPQWVEIQKRQARTGFNYFNRQGQFIKGWEEPQRENR